MQIVTVPATAPVLLVKPIRAGEGVSYGLTWRAPAGGWTALIGIGYGGGVRRDAAEHGATAAIRGVEYPIIGRVAMNATMVWLGPGSPRVAVGDEAVLQVADRVPVVGAVVEIDLGAYRRNLQLLRARIAPAELIAVVKNDAYGHGIARIVPAALAEGITIFAVQDLETARSVRPLASGSRLIAWLWTAEQVPELGRLDVELGVHSSADLALVAEASPGAAVHLKLDSGLHRGGVPLEDWRLAVRRAVDLDASGALRVVGAFTHLAEAGEDSDTRQLAAFRDAAQELEAALGRPVLKHAAASAAGFARSDARFDAVRFGAFTYGIAPGDGVGPAALGLEPAMRYLIRNHVFFGSQLRGEPTLQEVADSTDTIGEALVVQLPPGVERRYVDGD